MTAPTEQHDGGWAAVLRAPHSPRLLTATLVGRLPQCMAPLVLVLAARADGAGFGWGGLLAGAYCAALAAGQPLLGRLADRTGQMLPTAGGALVASLATAFLAVPEAASGPAGLPLALVSGLAAPPLEGAMRALWQLLVPQAQLTTAYSLDQAVQELAHVLAPLAVVVCVAAGGPRTALITMAVLGVLGAVAVAVSPPSRAWKPSPSSAGVLGALRARGMTGLLAVLVGVGVGLGGLYVTAGIAAEHWHRGWIAGVVPAAMSAGAIFGNAVYGWRPWLAPVHRQLQITAVGFAAGWLPLLTADTPTALVAGALIAGVCFGPLLTLAFAAADLLVPSAVRTESYGWLISAIGAGMALGTSIAGHTGGSLVWPLLAAVIAAALTRAVHAALRAGAAPAPAPESGPHSPSSALHGAASSREEA